MDYAEEYSHEHVWGQPNRAEDDGTGLDDRIDVDGSMEAVPGVGGIGDSENLINVDEAGFNLTADVASSVEPAESLAPRAEGLVEESLAGEPAENLVSTNLDPRMEKDETTDDDTKPEKEPSTAEMNVAKANTLLEDSVKEDLEGLTLDTHGSEDLAQVPIAETDQVGEAVTVETVEPVDELLVEDQPVDQTVDEAADQPAENPNNGDDDEFGEFDEFDATQPAVLAAPLSHTGPLRSADMAGLSADQIRSALRRPAGLQEDEAVPDLGDGTTPTSQQLWQHLTEPSWVPLPPFESSLMYKQMAVNLGIPQNLDASLPRQEQRRMMLPIGAGFEEIASLQKTPEWTLLAEVSPAALARMSAEELQAHVAHLNDVITEARALQEHMESREMDLMGEKNILEGMVDSLLVFSQRNQRERLRKPRK